MNRTIFLLSIILLSSNLYSSQMSMRMSEEDDAIIRLTKERDALERSIRIKQAPFEQKQRCCLMIPFVILPTDLALKSCGIDVPDAAVYTALAAGFSASIVYIAKYLTPDVSKECEELYTLESKIIESKIKEKID